MNKKQLIVAWTMVIVVFAILWQYRGATAHIELRMYPEKHILGLGSCAAVIIIGAYLMHILKD